MNTIKKMPVLPVIKKLNKPVAKSPPLKGMGLKAMLGIESDRRLLKNK